jgi:dTMP kinase
MLSLEVGGIELAGKLIVFEGLDFTGKTTQARLLARRLQDEGCEVVLTGEPGGTAVGNAVREILLSRRNSGTLDDFAELLLFLVSRAQHAREVVLPALEQGKTVVSSRYRLSSLAYQGYGRGIDVDLIERLNEEATRGRKADITFLIDVPVEVALARKRGDRDRIEAESEKFYHRVRDGFLELTAGDPSVHRIDGTGDVDATAAAVARCLGL